MCCYWDGFEKSDRNREDHKAHKLSFGATTAGFILQNTTLSFLAFLEIFY